MPGEIPVGADRVCFASQSDFDRIPSQTLDRPVCDTQRVGVMGKITDVAAKSAVTVRKRKSSGLPTMIMLNFCSMLAIAFDERSNTAMP